MKAKNNIVNILKIILVDIIWEIIYFPLWWYSSGVYRTGVFCLKRIKNQWNNMGLAIHFKFLFKPMYAQRDFAGRVISFFARFIQLIFKLVAFLVSILLFLIVFLLWIALPMIIIWQIVINLKFLKNVG